MLVLNFAVAGAGNCIEVAGAPFVFARTEHGSFVLPARCPHRGGPLNLAKSGSCACRLVCPWHDRDTTVTRFFKAGVPAARRGNSVTAVFPVPETAPYTMGYLPLSEELHCAARSEPVRRREFPWASKIPTPDP